MKSIHVVFLVSCIWFLAGAFYYPKWNNQGSEATISWDVSGYYHYLPAIFIYHDLKSQAYMDEINKKYLPSPAYDQAFIHGNSGNKVNKYAIGQAVLFSPFFLIAHAYTKVIHSFPADGYSKPYQISIWIAGLLISILGLVLLRSILLKYFDDVSVGWTLLAIGIGSHWLEYAAISNGMNHTWLFTLLCGLSLFVIRFNNKTDWTSAIGIGLCFGLAVLTRPTEIVWAIIPVLWSLQSIKERIAFLLTHWQKYLLAVFISGLIISIQLIYWKYVAGEWIVYSYGDQGFNWFNPKIWRGLMGVNVGWWLYTPIMLIAMFGWVGLYKKHKSIFWPICITALLAIYTTLSWGHWEEGGGLGQRNLIQIYPLLAFPLVSIITWFIRMPIAKWIWILILAGNIYYSGWWIHQAHKGGFFQAGRMTTPFFYNVVGRIPPNRDFFKLLDTKEYFKGIPKDTTIIYQDDFESNTAACVYIMPDSSKAACLNSQFQFVGPFNIIMEDGCKDWIRLEGDFTSHSREWDFWKYTQWIVQFHNGETLIKINTIRLQRILTEENKSTHIFFDVRIPGEAFDKCSVTIWNADSPNTMVIDNLRISCFSE